MPPSREEHYDTAKRGHFYFGERGHYHFGMTQNKNRTKTLASGPGNA
jgi:hypothetical protein